MRQLCRLQPIEMCDMREVLPVGAVEADVNRLSSMKWRAFLALRRILR
jgi:hypothetical protein